ncbi:hypothetical protein AB0F45_37620, partial [Streptomyces achromogenes]|uniref:hypothetical protein n=1 Tax=Streptomyces achromogenes TaxID=67255 RepID=UPI0033EE3126
LIDWRPPSAATTPCCPGMQVLIKGSGKRLLERHMTGRPGWSEYAARTSGFFPRQPHDDRRAKPATGSASTAARSAIFLSAWPPAPSGWRRGIRPPGSDVPPDDERLPCGRLLGRVWSDREEGTADGHQGTCPHCRRELAGLRTAVRHVRDETRSTPGFDAAALTQRVMDVVRLELRPGRPLPLGQPDEDLWIMESVAARTLRSAAEQVPGVQAGSCRIERPTRQRTCHRPPRHPRPLTPGLADEVRRHVREAADRHLGMNVTDINVSITDATEVTEATYVSDERGLSR